MSEIADFLRDRYRQARQAEASRRIVPGGLPFEWSWRREFDREWIQIGNATVKVDDFLERYGEPAADPAVLADLDAKLALIDELEPPEGPHPVDETEPWCCNGHAFHCPLCPKPRIGYCAGHLDDAASRELVHIDQLHARRAHPAYEYATTSGPRKQWDESDVPPRDDTGEPQPGWEPNTHAGCEDAWERFDYTEESYWRRLRPGGPRAPYIPRPLRILAQPFAGHPDHKGEEWAP